MNIITFEESQYKEKVSQQLEDIFFITSAVKKFASRDKRRDFFYTWALYYLQKYPKETYLAIDDENNLLGYLISSRDSSKEKELFKLQKYYYLFDDQFKKYPAHLHINCHPNSQGRGVGRELIKKFELDLIQAKILGVHIITSKNSQNVFFYEKMGFCDRAKRSVNGVELLFIGKSLTI